MRALSSVAALAALVVGIAPSAFASPLSLSSATLEFSFADVGLTAVAVDTPGIPVLVSSGGGSFVKPAGLLTGTATLLPSLGNLDTMVVEALSGVTTFTAAGGTGGGFGGSGGLDGTLDLRFLGAAINLAVPLSIVGGGGSFQATLFAITVTATGHGWTTGPAVITGLGSEYGTTVTISGYDNRSAAHAGAIQLVSPIRILTSFSGPAFPGYAAQTFVFVPEPGTLLLIGAAVAGLGVVGFRRSRR
jgi:hypothetical protein